MDNVIIYVILILNTIFLFFFFYRVHKRYLVKTHRHSS